MQVKLTFVKIILLLLTSFINRVIDTVFISHHINLVVEHCDNLQGIMFVNNGTKNCKCLLHNARKYSQLKVLLQTN